MAVTAKSQSLELRPSRGFARQFVESQFCKIPKPIPLTPGTSLARKTALVTGSTAGLGLQAARHLLSLNLSRLILAVRSAEKGETVARQLRVDFPSATVDVWLVEMSSYPSVQAFAAQAASEFSAPDKKLDIAILNAAHMNQDFVRNDATGHCNIIQVNYFSTVLLSLLLLPILRQRTKLDTPGRLTIVGSGLAGFAKLPNKHKRPFLSSFDDLALQPWDPVERYAASKQLLLMYLVKLLDNLPPAFRDEVVVNVVDPGYCKGSDLHRDTHGIQGLLLGASKAMTGRTLEQGAWTYVDAAIRHGKDAHGCFMMDCEIRP